MRIALLPSFRPATASRVLAGVLLGTLLTACGGASDTTSGPTPTSPTPVTPAPVAPGLLSLTITGLPAGTSADVSVTGANAATFSRTVTANVGWADVPPGRYTVAVRPVRTPNGTFAGAPATLTVDVTAGALASVTAAYKPVPSVLALTISGLPGGVTPAVSVTPPRGTATAVTQSGPLTASAQDGADATTDRWLVTAQAVTNAGTRFLPSPATLDTTLRLGDTARVAVAYSVGTGAVAVAVTGLPTGVSADAQLIAPDSTIQLITGTTTITGLEAGRYRLVARALTHAGLLFAPRADTLVLDVVRSLVATPATVTYVAQAGRLAVSVTGLPSGTNAALTLAGIGSPRPLTGSTTFDSLPAGGYTLSAAEVTANGDRYVPAPGSQAITVPVGGAATATVSYAIGRGSLTVTVNGLAGNAAVTVTGPGGYSQAVTGTTTLTGLEPGSYTVAAANVSVAGNSVVAAPATQTVAVTSAAAPATATVTYTQTTGSLALAVTGLPNGTSGSVTVTGPNSFQRVVTATTTLTGLAPGSYTVTAAGITVAGAPWSGSPATQTVAVTPSAVAAPAVVVYAPTPASLAIAVTGLPNGTPAAIQVTGPNSYSQIVTESTTLSNIATGVYMLTVSNVTGPGGVYAPSAATQLVAVSVGAVTTATVAYGVISGSLTVNVAGLPGTSAAAITVTGPSAFSRTVTGSTTLTGLLPGVYTVTASNVNVAGAVYAPGASTQSVTVFTGGTGASVTVTYSAQVSNGVNYTISNVYLTQAIQKPDGSVSLVANRDALLRVFVVATGANSAQPEVRVRLYDGTTLLQTNTIAAPEASVRTSISEGTLGSTWNLLVPASAVRPALRVLVDLDPNSLVVDGDRSDNSWPANGSPRAITVATAPTFAVRFVPVTVGSLTGNVSATNKEQFLTSTRRLWPVQNVTSDVRAPFTSSAPELQSGDANNAWVTVLSELNTLRTTDGAPTTTHYYGVVKVNYTSGIAGLGYVPGRAAMGWDYLPSGDGVAAHEWGHNFSRGHAPCGVAGDPGYPYSGGVINFWGWNSTTNALVSPTATDLMSYCSNTWVSDYNWTAVLNYRATSNLQGAALASATARQDGLLVWGRIVDGAIQLEPAFRVTAPITPAAARPTHRLDLLDDAGASLLRLPIEASLVDHVEGREERQFAVVVPWSAALADRLRQIRVADPRAPLRSVARQGAFASPAAARAAGTPVAPAALEPGEAVTTDGARVRVTWRNSAYDMAMVRDATTGQILGYVRRQGAAVVTGGRRVEVVFSDGVRSTVKTFR